MSMLLQDKVGSVFLPGDEIILLTATEGLPSENVQNEGNVHFGPVEHMKIHCTQKTFECDICSKKFIRKGGLTQHMFSHISEKHFECETCQLRFTCKQYLKNHMKTHSGEKNFECVICWKRFLRKANLVSHIKHHGTQKDHECHTCGMKFYRKQNLTAHTLNLHTFTQRFKCGYCSKIYFSKIGFKDHLKTKHKGQDIDSVLNLLAQNPKQLDESNFVSGTGQLAPVVPGSHI